MEIINVNDVKDTVRYYWHSNCVDFYDVEGGDKNYTPIEYIYGEDEKRFCEYTDFSDLSHINLLSMTLGKPKKIVKVYLNVIDFKMEYYVEDKLYRVHDFRSIDELLLYIAHLSWYSLIATYSYDNVKFAYYTGGITLFQMSKWKVELPFMRFA